MTGISVKIIPTVDAVVSLNRDRVQKYVQYTDRYQYIKAGLDIVDV